MLTNEVMSATILVADDEEQNRRLLADMLRMEGFKVVLAADGDEAIALFKSQSVDLVLADVMMPRRSGFAVCRVIKSNPVSRLVPVVLMTGLTGMEDRVQGIECGADDFLNKPIHLEELCARVRSLLRLKHFTDELDNAETVLMSLAMSIEAKDTYTEGHCDRLSQYSVVLGRALGVSEDQQVALRRGGVVHDVGKIIVPEHILLKPGPLTPEERKIMEQHPVVGERICSPLKSFRHVLPVIRHHHEKMDGSGYPDGLAGDAIPLVARIMTVVDVYDALTTARPYRKALAPQEAFRIMREEVKRGWWDEALVEQFAGLVALEVVA
ncbi:MAG TPA: HD domain-containing phosphohydrolase [Candidatus Saccharimonadales bacterium]|jgi:putative two-component system response regulator|nr:HD domain-containing phosphohydrolase [Candidatus Saccharimonadales bacterium]